MSWIEWIAVKLGWWTDYHVVCKSVDGGATTTAVGIFKVIPWLSANNYNVLKERVAEVHGLNLKNTVITSITKL